MTYSCVDLVAGKGHTALGRHILHKSSHTDTEPLMYRVYDNELNVHNGTVTHVRKSHFMFLELVEDKVIDNEPLLLPASGPCGMAEEIATDLGVLVSRLHLPQYGGQADLLALD